MNRRKRAFINHPLQRKYLRLVLISMGLPAILAMACIYYIIWQTVAREIAIPELIVETLFPAYAQVNAILLIGLPILFATIFYFSIQLTHRLAGPLERIERTLADMSRRHDFSAPIRIRKEDDLHGLVHQINRALHEACKR